MSEESFFMHSRTPTLDDLDENPCYHAWHAYLSEHGHGLDLSISNPTVVGLGTTEIDVETLYQAVCAPYCASSQGLEMARKAISTNYYAGRVAADRLQLFASTSEAVGALLKLLCAPGDEVVTCTPTYPLLDCLTSLEAVRLNEVPFQDCAGEWEIDFYALDRVCQARTRAVIVVSPNNPTGHIIRRDEMDKLVSFCAKRHMALIVDEVFGSYRFNEDSEHMPEAAAACFDSPGSGLIVSLSGLSKVCGLPQHKLGWAIFGGDPAVVDEAMQRMSFIADSTLSVAGWIQRMMGQLLKNRTSFAESCLVRCRENLAFLQEQSRCDNVKWRVDRVDGGWSACIRLPGWCNDECIATRIAMNGVRVFPGSFFGFLDNQPTLVISLIVQPDIMQKGFKIIADVLEECL